MANRYDSVAQYNPVDTYVPIPFQEISQAAQYRQKRADEIEATEVKLGDLAVAKGLDAVRLSNGELVKVNDLTDAKKFVEDYNTKLTSIANKIGTGDRSNPDYRREVLKLTSELKNALGSEGALGKATYNQEQYKQLQETLMKSADDISKQPWLASQYDNELRRFASSPGSALQSGVGIGKYVDINKEVDDLTKGLESQLISTYGPSMGKNGLITSGLSHGVIAERVAEVAKNAISTGNVGNSFRQKAQYLAENYMRGGELTREEAVAKATKEVAEEQSSLLNTMIQKYTSSEVTTKEKFLPEFWAKRMGIGVEDALNPLTDLSSVTNNAMVSNILDDIDLDKDGKVWKIGTYSTSVGTRGYGVSISSDSGSEDTREIDLEKQKIVDYYVQQYKGENPNTRLQPKEIIALYKNSITNYKNIPVYHNVMGTSEIEDKNKLLSAGASKDSRAALTTMTSGKKVVVLGTAGSQGVVVNGDTLFHRDGGKKGLVKGGKGQTTLDLDAIETVSIVGRSTGNPYGMPGAYVVKVASKNGGTRTLLIDSSLEEQSAFADMDAIYRATYTGLPEVTVPLSDGREYRVKNVPTDSPESPFKTVVRWVDEETGQGMTMPVNKFIAEQQKRAKMKLDKYSSGNLLTKGDKNTEPLPETNYFESEDEE